MKIKMFILSVTKIKSTAILFIIPYFFSITVFAQNRISNQLLKYFSDGIPQAVTVSNDTAFICFGGEIKIFLLENPNQPVEIASFSIPASIKDILFDSGMIYLIADKLYLLSFNNIIEEISEYPISGFQLELKNNDLFILSSLKLSVLDVSDPYNLSLKGDVSFFYYTDGLSIKDQHAFVATDGGLYMMNISDPGNITTIYVYETSAGTDVRDVRCNGNLVYATIDPYLTIFEDIGNSLEIINEINIHYDIQNISINNDKLFVTDWTNGIYIYNINDPANPIFNNLYNTSGASAITENNSTAIILRSHNLYFPNAVEVLDISQSTPLKLCDIDVNGAFADLAALDEYVYVSYYKRNVVQIINFTDDKPLSERKLLTLNIINSLEQKDSTLFVCTTDGLEIYDLGNPVSPIFLSSIDLGSDVLNVIINNNICYLGTAEGVLIYDINDIIDPIPLSIWGGTGYSLEKIAFQNDRLYFVTKNCMNCWSKIEILDVTNPAAPQFINSINPYNVYNPHIAISSDMLLVFDGNLLIYNINNPNSPYLVSEIQLESTYFQEPHKIYAENNRVWCVSNNVGIFVVDFTNPSEPQITGTIHIPGEILSVVPTENDLLGTGKETGVFLFDKTITEIQDNQDNKLICSDPENLVMKTYPNPSNGQINIKYILPENGYVRMGLYNNLGEKVTEVIKEYKTAGEYITRLRSEGFASGIYYLSLEENKYRIAKKVIFLK